MWPGEANRKLKELGIKSTWRSHEGVQVQLNDETIRLATQEEAKLHEQDVFDYHMDEAENGLL